jgi:hypothetical protein
MTYQHDDSTDESEAIWHHNLAAEVFDLQLDRELPVEAQRNVLSVTTEEVCFAQRLDCRTYFVEHQGYGHDAPTGVFRGPDEDQLGYARTLLQRLAISDQEIASEEVLREFGQAAQVDPYTHEVISVEAAKELRTMVHLTRHVGGTPVWSSHLKMGLTAKRTIGFLELHWPVIPDVVIAEAQRLAFKVSNEWAVPEQAAAELESAEAGIVHTPAVGYFFDVHPAIRVVYRSLDTTIGRKPTYYFDRHGDVVPLRPTSDLISERTLNARPGNNGTGCSPTIPN